MGLNEYKRKRSFDETPEPTGGKPTGKKLQFVIQKHAASRLHYDFRLELDGVLKSWAVPKGPSLNPTDKRLAMLVEDHPLDYKNFEGIIPAGNYGAGSVIIWDAGTYEPLEGSSRAEHEEKLRQDFEKGSLKFRLHGDKLKGEFALVRMKGKEKNSWLLIKHRDEFASDEDVAELDKSVISGKTVDEIGGRENGSSAKSKSLKPAVKTALKKKSRSTTAKRSSSNQEVKELLKTVSGKKRSAMPEDVSPMLATLVDAPFDEPGWLYEIKWDGFRAISYLKGGEVSIRSRNNKDFNDKFYPVYQALQEWSVNVVVDGEIIVVDDDGMPDFNALQQWRSEADGHLLYYIFDLLWIEGYDLMKVPLRERKEMLAKLIPGEGILRVSESFGATGKEMYEQAEKLKLEGIVAKKDDAEYTPGIRSKTWLKIKTQHEQEVIIGGYTLNENTKKTFSALLMGVYEKDKLVFVGPVGTGFSSALQQDLMQKMKPLETKECPFAETPDYNKPSRFRPNPPKARVVWLKPELIAEVAYRARTDDGSMRHPSFKGLRDDKKPKEVVPESPTPISKVVTSDSLKKKIKKPVAGQRNSLLNPSEETQVRKVEGKELKFTNLSKIFWPEDGYTKRDMLNYYYQMAPFILPYMKDRPQTLNRFPNGIHGKSFYQKDVSGKVPSWVKTHAYFSEGDDRQKEFLVCTDEASLLYIASLGCIELHPWSSRSQHPDNPDWCIIDLDPDKKTTFDQVIEAAQVTHQILDAINVPNYCKTSGSTGIHIYIPLGAAYSYEESKEFARALVKLVHAQLPGFTTIERKVSDRGGKMYLDFLQNRPQATVAGPYSLRPKPGAPVSMPLPWEDVKKGLKISQFTMANAVTIVRSQGDLFRGVLGAKVDIHRAMVTMMKVFGRIA
jgi:bifunctional non-homologous end joining protein LigD